MRKGIAFVALRALAGRQSEAIRLAESYEEVDFSASANRCYLAEKTRAAYLDEGNSAEVDKWTDQARAAYASARLDAL